MRPTRILSPLAVTTLVCAFLIVVPAKAAASFEGTWRYSADSDHARPSIELEVRSGGTHVQNWSSISPARIPELANAGSGERSVSFELHRDPGTFVMTGTVRDGVGAGLFTFTPDPAFATALAKRGYTPPTPDQQLRLAMSKFKLELVDDIARLGYERPSTRISSAPLCTASTASSSKASLVSATSWETSAPSPVFATTA